MSRESYFTFIPICMKKVLPVFRPEKRVASSKITRISIFGFLLTLVLTLGVPANSYALDKNPGVKWELIYLSPYGGCTNYQYQMANEYDEITSKYFDSYKFENSKYQPQCMSDEKYTHYKVPDDLDLLILVYDNEIGKKDLHSNAVGGLYNHVGTDRTKDHTIIFCDCSNFGFSDPDWILSHELSHFITYYLGFDLAVVENKIHSLDTKYDECIDGHRDNTCSNVMSHVYGDHYFTSAVVMTPYQPAIGKKLIPVQNDTAKNITSNGVADSQLVMNMQKEITKWWLAGKINDTDYSKELGYIVGNPDGAMKIDELPHNVMFADGPNGIKENTTIYDAGSGVKQEDSVILKRIPFKQENTTSLSDQIQIPQWFKFKAYHWSQDELWSNEDFVSAIKYLFNNETGK